MDNGDIHIDSVGGDRTTGICHLLHLDYYKHSVLYNNNHFHNHTPHFLSAAYLLGASVPQLQQIYDDAVTRSNLEPWLPSPSPITSDTFHTHFGQGEYQKAYIDFLDTQLPESDTEDQWKATTINFLLDNASSSTSTTTLPPLLYSLVAGVAHPLIHLGYAFELNSRTIAIEALTLAATCYNHSLASLLTTQTPILPPTSTTLSLTEIFSRVHSDGTLPTFGNPGDANISTLLSSPKHTEMILSYVKSWSIPDPEAALSQAFHLSSLLLISSSTELSPTATSLNTNTHARNPTRGYDFFLCHILTSAHAVRSILPYLPQMHQVILLREWLLLALLVYIAQQRPSLDVPCVNDAELCGQDWEHVREMALEGEHSSDAHFVKVVWCLMAAAERGGHLGARTEEGNGKYGMEYGKGNGGEEEWFLKCAVIFVGRFEKWQGFDESVEGAEEVRLQRLRDGIHV